MATEKQVPLKPYVPIRKTPKMPAPILASDEQLSRIEWVVAQMQTTVAEWQAIFALKRELQDEIKRNKGRDVALGKQLRKKLGQLHAGLLRAKPHKLPDSLRPFIVANRKAKAKQARKPITEIIKRIKNGNNGSEHAMMELAQQVVIAIGSGDPTAVLTEAERACDDRPAGAAERAADSALGKLLGWDANTIYLDRNPRRKFRPYLHK